MDQIEYVKSNKGGVKIIYKGYMYTVHKNKKCGGVRWRCAQRSLNCKGSISTSLNGTPQINMPHNHLPDYQSIAVARNKFEENIDFHTIFDIISMQKEMDSMPLEQRLTKIPTDEPVLQSQPLSPTKLKVTRQSAKPPQLSPKPPTPEPPNEEVCLRWNSHHSNMQTTFPNLLLREQYVDATLVSEGQTLKCHRLILSSCSPYFEEVLSGISPFQHPVLFMKDVPFWILKSLCDFMYAGEVHIFQNRLEELLAVAETLKIKGLAGKQDPPVDETKPAEPKLVKEVVKPVKEVTKAAKEAAKPVKDEKKEEKETKEKKKQVQNESTAKSNSKSKTSASKRNEKPSKEIAKSDDIIDPLDLLEPVYEELTKESKVNSTTAKSKESKVVPVRRNLQKKLKKRKLSEREESPPPFLSRKGTRSRPNVKIPKFYHPPYDRNSKAIASPESTIVREPHTDQADPLLQVEEIKAEPMDMEDDVIEIQDNVIEFTDHEMSLHEEEIIGNYDSPIVNPNEDGQDVSFKKISLIQQPIIMDVHTITEKPAETLKIIDVAQIKGPTSDKRSDTETGSIMIVAEVDKIEDPLNFITHTEKSGENEEAKENAIGFRIEEVVGAQDEKETDSESMAVDEERRSFQPAKIVITHVEKSGETEETKETAIGFRIEEVVGAQDEHKETDSESTVADEDRNSCQPAKTADKEENHIGFRIEEVVGGQAEDKETDAVADVSRQEVVDADKEENIDFGIEEVTGEQDRLTVAHDNKDSRQFDVDIEHTADKEESSIAEEEKEICQGEVEEKPDNEGDDRNGFQTGVDIEMRADREENAGTEERETELEPPESEDERNSREPGFHIAKVAEEQIAAEHKLEGREALTEDPSDDLGFQIASVSGQFECEPLENSFSLESQSASDVISDETQLMADSLEELLDQ